ncbi:RNA-binding protein 44 isoform X3 [Betta splendens]|nr:RNA-binding protein 44 isoform X3 [Betta splendens]XP_028993713.1 RNA-binding protein 44 isoform X3 [Betta splendens]
MWHGCPWGSVYGGADPVPFYANGYVFALVPAPRMPLRHNALTLSPNPGLRCPDDVIKKKVSVSTEETRRLLLDRRLFDLVDAHPYLELTDPKLLGWYLGLSAEDRTIIQADGGLQNFLLRHPALELTPHHVYVKARRAHKAPRSILPRQNLSTNGMSPTVQELNVYSNNMWKNSAVSDPTNRQDGSQKQPCEDPGIPGSFCLDTVLERCRPSRKSEHRSFRLVTQDQTPNFSEVHPSQSEWSTIKNTSLTELSSSDYLRTTENGTKKEIQDCQVYNEGTINTANVGSSQGRDICTILDEDKSILVCVTSDDQKTYSGTVSPNGETLAPRSELLDGGQSLNNSCSEEKGPFPLPRVSCDTESAQCVSAFTQTNDPVSSDKQINTEICMADVDYVAVEFLRLKKTEEKVKNKCDCMQRAQQAELSLLSLQYRMCRQHCWSLHCAAAGGNQGSADGKQHCPVDPPADISAVLNKLESDYNELSGRILEGVPLEQLKPLSVNCGKITPAPYIPAQVIASMQGSVPQPPQDLQRNRTPTNDSQRETKEVTQQNSSAKRAVPVVPQASGALCDAQTLADTQTASTTLMTELTRCHLDLEAGELGSPGGTEAMCQVMKDQSFGAWNVVLTLILLHVEIV